MEFIYIIGMDFGKDSFDACLMNEKTQVLDNEQFTNNKEGFQALLKWLKSLKINMNTTLFCAENMGACVREFSAFSLKRKLNLSLACPLDIKKSIGLTRGKNDKIDAYRIAFYAIKHQDRLKLFEAPKKVLQRLRQYLKTRQMLVKLKVAVQAQHKDVMSNEVFADMSALSKMLQQELASLKAKIKECEEAMEELLASEPAIYKNRQLLKTIIGIGLINIVTMICQTENFTRFTETRKYACYCGIAPFEYSSGTSIRGRTKVSHYANKEMKHLLAQAVQSAKIHDPQLKAYYERKLAEGKHKSVVMNAIKFKILDRCFAVIRRQTPYVKLQIL